MKTDEKRTDLQEKMEHELSRRISQMGIDCAPDALLKALKSSGFISITPPVEQKMLYSLDLDQLNDYDSGSSIKPGNIRLNLHKLVDTIPAVVEIAASGVSENVILKICAALNIWKLLRDMATIEISKDEAFVIVAL